MRCQRTHPHMPGLRTQHWCPYSFRSTSYHDSRKQRRRKLYDHISWLSSAPKTFVLPFFVTFKMSVFRLTTPDWRGPQTQWRQRGNESVKRWIGVPTTLILTYLQTTWLNRNTTSPVKHSSMRNTLTDNFQISDILLRFQTIAAQSRALSKTWPNFAHFDHHPTCKIKGKMENSKW